MIRYLRAVSVLALLLLGMVLLVVTGALWNPHTRVVKIIMKRWFKVVLGVLGVSVTVRGHLPSEQPDVGHILVSNHVSWLDIPLIGSLVDANFLSKDEVRRWPLIGKLAEGAGTLFIKRGSGDGNQVAEQIAARTNKGHSVLFFPEGTSTDGTAIKTLYPKLFKACHSTQAAFYPVIVHYDVPGQSGHPIAFINDDDFSEHLWRMMGFSKINATVIFLEPRQFYGDQNNEAVGSLKDQVKALHGEMSHVLAQEYQYPNASSNTESASAP